MKNILAPWNFRRILYFIGGMWILIQSFMDQQWVFLLLGGYFMLMGLMNWGCASGQCSVSDASVKESEKKR